ncbi:hypothetical protein E1B28_004089 [Marasmius oreades]|uniref:Sodium/calcium exchanger membrane region domain-containing protein n=1 Tax=Marasmius oreades TaxID=181124 RepID=A0A9P8ACU1_9AGAR|nr:uncharacterized protein E1B28_004089 [Marasmius oreades]KAG7096675.1 hypothetical protein E1B28_004089 [Marasmius oreades]
MLQGRYTTSDGDDHTVDHRMSQSYEEPKYVTPDGLAQVPRQRLSQQPAEEARALLGTGHDRSGSVHQNRQESMLRFQHGRFTSHSSFQTEDNATTLNGHNTTNATKRGSAQLGDRFFRRGKKKIGVLASLKGIALHSWLNPFVVFIPISWVAHFYNASRHHEGGSFGIPYPLIFLFSLLAVMPLQKFFDYGGEQMSFYVGKDLGDLIVVTLNNAVEATLAVILLIKCEIKLLQATIIGVILLHLLLVPGTAFIVDGARLLHQDLHPHLTQLNHTLLIMGVLSLLLPGAFFSVIDRSDSPTTHGVDDTTRHTFLMMSRGLAVILLVVYISSRFYLHNPPGDEEMEVPMSLRNEEEYLLQSEPALNQWVCIGMLIVALGLMATTAVWLVDSVEVVRLEGNIPEEWFGLILLPFVSFSADGALALGYFVRYVIQALRGKENPPARLARAQAIDLSIQFILFWMPAIVLLGWWMGRPLPLLFDFFEIAILFGSCFLVNYVTQDAKTNWAEGVAMVGFYAMIVLCAWFYRGPKDIVELLKFGVCTHAGGH